MLEPNAMVGDPPIPCISLRDEPWEEARSVLLHAIADGYLYWALDDGFLLAKEPLGYGPTDHEVNPDNPSPSLLFARWWWQH